MSAGERDHGGPSSNDEHQTQRAQDEARQPVDMSSDFDAPTVPTFPREALPSSARPARASSVDTTLDLPADHTGAGRRMPRWTAYLLIVLVLGLLIPGALYARGGPTAASTVPPGCEVQDSPCQIARDFLTQYAAGHYDAMYEFVSDASKKQFGSAAILSGNYTDAHDYIVTRTSLMVQQAQVYAMDITPGNQRLTGTSTAVVPAHVVMHTLRVGDVVQNITVPLVHEAGHWRVSWTPGLIFSQLNDPADPNYRRLVHLCAYDGHRGRILDRNGNVLAQDDTVYQIFVNPTLSKNQAALTTLLAKDLGASTTYITGLIAGATGDVLVRTVTGQAYQQFASDLTPYVGAGVDVQTTQGRVYPYGEDAAAVTGYVHAVSAQDLLDDTNHYYAASDVIGAAGVEAWAEDQLRPVKGGELDILPSDAGGDCGKALYTLGRRTPADGADVQTAIDIGLQQRAMSEMRAYDRPGGTVSFIPTTGEVLVLASNPMYDPNTLSLPRGLTDLAAQTLNNEQGYLNRAIAGTYPIGSAFKFVTLSAGLENGVSPTSTYDDTGSYLVPGESQPRRQQYVPNGWGVVTLEQGLAWSSDTLFWSMAVTLNAHDPTILPNMAKAFGYGQRTGIVGLPSSEEDPGVVPDPTWIRQNENAGWSPSDAANLAVGQGFFLATPLQVAEATQAVANNGTRLQPRLVTSIAYPGGVVLKSFPQTKVGTLPITSDHLAIVEAGMVSSTTLVGGTTAGLFQNYPVKVAAKTGTAESNTADPHAIFTCFAPATPVGGAAVTPKIVLSTIIEHGGLGAERAAPVAKDVVSAYLHITP